MNEKSVFFVWFQYLWTKPNIQVFNMLECVCYVCALSSCRFSVTLYIRSISINLDGVDTVLCQASCLQKRTVVTQLHTLAGEVVSLEQLQPVVLSVLQRKMTESLTESWQEGLPSPLCKWPCVSMWPSLNCVCVKNDNLDFLWKCSADTECWIKFFFKSKHKLKIKRWSMC